MAGAIVTIGLLAATCASAEATTPQPRQLYVSPAGSDAWPGTKQQPFATLQRAQQQVRTLTAAMRTDVVVNLRRGTHTLSAPLELSATAGDSGQNGHDVVYQAHGYGSRWQEPVVVSGGRRISGWQRASAGSPIWQADVGDLDTRQLYVEGRRATRAALGGGLPGRLTATTTGYVTDSVAPQAWADPQDVELVYQGAYPWSEARCQVESITGDATSSTITMEQPCYRWAKKLYSGEWGGYVFELIDPTAVENSASFLSEPGSFSLDRSVAGHHVLSYLPRSGEEMSSARVIAPVLQTLISGEGTASAPLHDVAFKGLTLSHATWLAPNAPTGFPQIFANVYENGDPPDELFGISREAKTVPGNVAFHGAQRIELEGNRFTQLGAVALELSRNSSHNVVRGNVFSDVSGGGIVLGVLNPETSGTNRGNVIDNNWVHDIGVEYHGSPGINVVRAQDTTVSHNQVDHVPYSGIVFTGVADDQAGTPADLITRGARVLDNLVFDVTRTLHDGGAIYTSGAQGTSWADAALVRGNVVHDSDPVGPIGLYTDESGNWTRVLGNVSYRNGAAFGGCALPQIRNTLIADNFWDDDVPNWGCGEPESVEVRDNTLLPRATFEQACQANWECRRIVRGAGLQFGYRHLLRR
ncbi:right-handed parallel beta-helix repeat-containing protein [Conexibacter stalactiti]|uniref:Right-handed parallel beta-helix repeat-containing protein n=1 Tax=Conexibacter stalactiti TaxID=1940611 RepID=A0ABU4HL92_9ACTN|nr:right-handed parallel beta-helix repeat-containing protein [Conexibacter stalactiti]MDW5594091.1 right-handed parallel beta-helix repeat-containing protein [Conexibacter stalactiti]MEC5034733.1 right-handed parallel beta-helix repeat-containing protein [Conexibacter stalactiti]